MGGVTICALCTVLNCVWLLDALASLESGELAPSVAADPPQDPAMMRIRLERAKNLMKLKLGSSGDASGPKPAENSLEDELDVHFEP